MNENTTKTDSVVSLNACWQGLKGDLSTIAFWTAFGAGMLYGANQAKLWIYGNYGATTFKEFDEAHRWITGTEFAVAAVAMVIAIAAVIILMSLFCAFIKCFYDAKRKVHIDKEQRLITITEYGFPFSQEQVQISFDRIIQINVKQSLIDRCLNTGDLSLELITNANADSVEITVVASDIMDPYGARERILSGEPEYKGLKLDVPK